MRQPPGIRAALKLGPVNLLQLAGWKIRQAAIRRSERRSCHATYEAASQAFADGWADRWGAAGLGAWLRRSEAMAIPVAAAESAVWCRETCTADDLALAEAVVSGVFDLIGSGPRVLGMPPRWRTDLYTGFEWPLEESDRLHIVRGDGTDIRTVWELSRCYHFPALARAYWRTGDARFSGAFRAHVESFIEQNPPGRGPHWASPMDAAIRAANWALGLVLFADAPELEAAFVGRMLGNLYATAMHVERHREWHPVYRGNHFVANGVGLAYLGALFADDGRGRRWLRRGTRIIADEQLRQVRPDGVSFEGSIGYHRLATQLFGWGAIIVRQAAPRLWTTEHERRLAAMFEFIDVYTPPSGLAPLIGDNDDGHLHVMDARMLREPRRHQLGLPPRPVKDHAPAPAGSRLYRDGGFAVMRAGADHCVVHCGPVGLLGAGSHDHNDQLSFELVIDGVRVVRDSGTYCYTRDLEQRYAFRATAAHNALQLGGEEQNPIRADRPWRVQKDRTIARIIAWEDADTGVRFVGEHRGFVHRPGRPVIRRQVRYVAGDNAWHIQDAVIAETVADELLWSLHLDLEPTVLEEDATSARLRVGSCQMVLAWAAGLRLEVGCAPSSDRYGAQELRPVLRLRGQAQLPVTIHVIAKQEPVVR